MAAIEVIDLHKSYRKGFFRTKQKVLSGLSFQVPEASITGFLGSNGAGKTTTLKCILGLVLFEQGRINFFNQGSLTVENSKKIGFLPENPYFYQYLTGQEFLEFYGKLSTSLKSYDLKLRIKKLLKRVRLEHAADRALRTYSKGMLQRIGLAQALIHEPKLVILDEPMAGVDPDGRIEISEIIKETLQTGASIFFSSHLLHDAEVLCHHLVIVRQGKLAYEGSTQKLLHGLQTGYRLSFLERDKPSTIILSTQDELQRKIDEIRKNQNQVLEVRVERPSLEEAFAKITSGAQL